MFDQTDFRTPYDSAVESEEADLDTLLLEIRERDRVWGERLRLAVAADRLGSVPIREVGEALRQIFLWISANAKPLKGKMAKWELDKTRDDWAHLPEGERVAHRACRVLAARVLAAMFVLDPKLMEGESESKLAARLNVTRALISHYCTEFASEFGMQGRGMKSFAARIAYSEAQVGNTNRAGGKKKQQQQNEEDTLL
jgi:hypothetical protein